ncbi:hypothetical protein [Mesorhizobium sp. ES1-4]|uniref:hypothetical protein n=1 Tax=Mesorhizobium sp. ES1-4 TaxID=2876627 RepID=UPI001CCE0C27|nr:hypothetical protein [Mesorhizobium sp. ES1-4]MBZ9798391.1 hypothetical protein [Mesorhizobium sp. ES1-4]
MPTYLVEEMHNDRSVRSRAIDAPTPLRAASELINRKIGSQTWEKKWIRVTDEVRGEEFAYSIENKDMPAARAPRGA